MSDPKRYWLMKCEPYVYSIDDLKRDKTTHWDGVRNYKARNYMRDEMKIGDGVIFYHSNADPSGAAGLAKVCKLSYPDFTAFDPDNKYFDPKSTQDNPTWFMVDIEFEEKFANFVPLAQLKADERLEGMMVVRRGMRLSIQPVDKEHFEIIKQMGRGQ